MAIIQAKIRDLHQYLPPEVLVTNGNQLYTCGIWLVKPGKEKAFIEVWGDFANWTTTFFSTPGVAMLLQDTENPDKFVSYGPWESPEQISSWRETTEFKAFAEKVKGLCENFQPHTMRVAKQTK